MIEINLLPGPKKKKRKASRGGGVSINFAAIGPALANATRDRWLAGTIGVCAGSVLTIAVLFLLQNGRSSSLTERLNKDLADSTKLVNKLHDRIRAQALHDTVVRQVSLIRALDEDRYVWPHILDEVSKALPPYTWLTSLNFVGTPQGSGNVVTIPKMSKDDSANAKKRGVPPPLKTDIPRDEITLHISGQSVDAQAITRYMRDLVLSPFIKNLVWDRSVLAQAQGKEVWNFELTVNYRRPDSTQIRREPYSISGK